MIGYEWERRKMQSGSSNSAFVARSGIKQGGSKPKWQANKSSSHPYHSQRPQQPQGQGQQPYQWGTVQHKKPNQFQPKFKKPFRPTHGNQPQPKTLAQGQKGPNYERNERNRQNRRLAALVRRGDAGPSNENANIPKFANMALQDRISPGKVTIIERDNRLNPGMSKSIKEELMDVDLSSDNFPILSRKEVSPLVTGRSHPLGNHRIEMPDLLTEANLSKHRLDNDGFEVVTEHEWLHAGPMGDRCYSSQEEFVKSQLWDIIDLGEVIRLLTVFLDPYWEIRIRKT
jgi:hypothetical protein